MAEEEECDCVDCHVTVHVEFPDEKYGPNYPDELLCHQCEKKRLAEEIKVLRVGDGRDAVATYRCR